MFGIAWNLVAREFVAEFPVGTDLSYDDFDTWAFRHNLVPVVPKVGGGHGSVSRDSEAWLAHLQRRHRVRYNLNKAGTHPRMFDGSVPFTLDSIGVHALLVRAPHEAAFASKLPHKIESLVKTKKRQLIRLLQGTQWNRLGTDIRYRVEMLKEEIDEFQDLVNSQTDRLERKFKKLESKLRDAGAMLEAHTDDEEEPDPET